MNTKIARYWRGRLKTKRARELLFMMVDLTIDYTILLLQMYNIAL